ncbi:MarR family transcriptional regulator [Kineosporia mesophila]|nr:MarR family transcriptional regulator [Kineosporia mesophila]MCD5351938.1 MarR family transcriptional regulator [Kineosporia mesophila]
MQRLPREIDEDMMRETGLTMTEFAVLHALSAQAGGTLRVTGIAADIGLSSSRVSRVVTALSARGWCRRTVDSSDGRAALAELTSSGRAKVEEALPHHTVLARRRILDHIPSGERDIVLRALKTILEAPQ